MLGAATRLPAAETGRRGWGRVLIFQGPAKGLWKNQYTQPVKAAHLRFSFWGNVYRGSWIRILYKEDSYILSASCLPAEKTVQ